MSEDAKLEEAVSKKERMIGDSFVLPEGMRDRLNNLAKATKRSKAELIREGIQFILDKYESHTPQ